MKTLLAVLCFVVAFVPAGLSTAQAEPTASRSETDAAKRRFEAGLRLLKEGLHREALAAFLEAKRMAPRESIQRNIAHTHRELRQFAEAHDAYVELLAVHGTELTEAGRNKIQTAIDELKMMTATIRVDIAEPEARITIDDLDVGSTPLAQPLRLNLGTYSVKVAKPGFESLVSRVELRAGNQEVVVRGPLEKAATTGHLAVVAKDGTAARLFVDGNDVGSLPWEGELDPGTHELRAQGATVASAPRRVEVVRGQRVEVELELAMIFGTLRIDAADADAVILVDGKTMGKGAWEGRVEPGRHIVEIRRTSAEPQRRVVIVNPGQVVNVGNVALVEGTAPTATSSSPVPEQPHDYRGLYVQLATMGTFLVDGDADDLYDLCQDAGANPCSRQLPLGAGMALRGGYSAGWYSGELTLLGQYETWKTEREFDAPSDPENTPTEVIARKEEWNFHRTGFGVALGARVTSKHPSIRFTAGMAFGLLLRWDSYVYEFQASHHKRWARHVANAESHDVSMFLMDAGMLLGSTPGLKFLLGAQLLVEMDGASRFHTAPPKYAVGTQELKLSDPLITRGARYYLGPVLGMQFGE